MLKRTDTSRVVDFKLLGRLFQALVRFHNPNLFLNFFSVPKFLLKTIYYSIFHSHLIYGCEVWGSKPKQRAHSQIAKASRKSCVLN